MKDRKAKPDVTNIQVDAEKIINHINYTRHWLEKADNDYKNKQFGSGSMILGLARAELTAAWEEALQLKTQVFRKMPKKARGMVTWKNSSAAGLLAAGFLMAFIVIRVGNYNINNPKNAAETHTLVFTEEPVKVRVAPKPAVALALKPSATPTEVSEANATAAGTQASVKTPALRRSSISTAAPRNARESAEVKRAEPAVKPVAANTAEPQVTPAVVAFPEPARLATPAPAPTVSQPAPQAPSKPKANLDGIDLYKTADDALKK